MCARLSIMANKKILIPASRKRTNKRLTVWVPPDRAEALKEDAKQKGLIFSFYLEKLLEDAWSRRNV